MNILTNSLVVFQLLLLAVVVQSVRTPFKDCGSVNGAIINVDISGCDKVPCPLVRGTNITMSLTFKSNVQTNTAVNYMYGIIAGVQVPYALPESDGCKLGMSCPLSAGKTYTEVEVFPVLKEYPLLTLYVKMELKSDDGKDLACYVVPCKIVDPSN